MNMQTQAAPELRVGRLAWAKRLAWEWVSGPHVREKHGVTCGYVANAVPVVIERAAGGSRCDTCNREIERRELIGRSVSGDFFCSSCVTTVRPPRDFRPADARAEEEFLAARNQARAPRAVSKATARQTAARSSAGPGKPKTKKGRAA